MRAYLFVLFCVALVAADTRVTVVNEYHDVPVAYTDAPRRVTYIGIYVDMDEFIRPSADSWLQSFEDQSDPNVVHHKVVYGVPRDSGVVQPGGFLHGLRTGDFIPNAIEPTDGIHRTNSLFSNQVPQGGIDLPMLFDGESATANEWTYGIPLGRQSTYKAVIVTSHIHLDHHEMAMKRMMNETVRIKFKYLFTTTTNPPKYNLGTMLVGVPAQANTMPYTVMNITYEPQIDGYSITGRNLPNAANCAVPGATPCDTCCPYAPYTKVDLLDGLFAQRLESQGLSSVKLVRTFIHAHRQQRTLELKKIALDGTMTPISSCVGCGPGTWNPGATEVLNPPVPFFAGEGFELTCTYNALPGNANLIGGLRSDEEMCIASILYAYPVTENIPNPGHLMLFPTICDAIVNIDTPSQGPLVPALDGVCKLPTCLGDPICYPPVQ